MSNPYPNFPSTLPLPLTRRFSGRTETVAMRTQIEGPVARQRDRFKEESVMRLNLSFNFSPGEFDTWKTFVRETLQFGAKKFNIELLLEGESLKEFVVKIVGDWTHRYEGGMFVVGFQAETENPDEEIRGKWKE